MKKINFINPIARHHQLELNIWALVTIATIIALLFYIALITSKQYYYLYTTIREKNNVAASVNHILDNHNSKTFNQEYALLQKQLHKLSLYKQKIEQPINHLKIIQKLCKAKNSSINSLKLTQQILTMSFYCPDSKNALQLIQELNETPSFTNARITTLVKDNKDQTQQPLLCTLQAEPKII